MNLMEIFEVAYKYRALFIEGTIGTLQLALCAGHGTNSVGNMPTTGYCRQV